ncbi:MAG: glycosyltransferase family 4 protein, partial [Synergistaceae bacterium]|nr:glycosyltransferase family 4 protein [Synergistaceae bacterium]
AQSTEHRAQSHNYSQKLRVLYVSHGRGLGGANLALYNLMLDMRERHGVIPSVLIPGREDFFEMCHESGIETFCTRFYDLTCSTNFRSKFKGFAKYLLNRICYPRVFSILKDANFDIVHTNSSVTDVGSLISERHSFPHVWHLREFGIDDFHLDYYVSYSWMKSRYAKADAIITISDSVYNSFVNERKLCQADKTRMIYDGLRIPEPYTKTYMNTGILNFCISGMVSPAKNQVMAIKACSKLKASTDKFMLHIVGTGKEKYKLELQKLIASCGLDEHVKFWGWRDDVNNILKTMDVGLMLSRCEGFGRVTVEYMLNYMPVIGVDTGATPEIVVDGETGYICHLNDTDKLAELMHRFITNPELIQAMGNKGRERAEQNYSLERNTDEIYALYQEILSR